jgi:hypothetical protein
MQKDELVIVEQDYCFAITYIQSLDSLGWAND